MSNILKKEIKLSASVLSYLFILFGFMFFLPGYPVLCGAFFSCLGIFQSFQNTRETNDIVFSALLPIAKEDVVKGKFLFACFIELCTFVMMVAATLIRMTVLSDASVYRENALMNANPFALGLALVIFGIFNLVFIGGFFKTVYKLAKPFITYIVITFIVIGAGEVIHHIPGLEAVNAFCFENIGLQLILLFAGIIIYVLLTMITVRLSCRRFEKIDL